MALITGGDSGIGKAAAIAFAREGADVAIAYLYEASDAEVTQRRIEQLGRRCLRIETDLRHKQNCFQAVEQTVQTFGKLDILVNNHGVQYPQKSILDISEEQLLQTFHTNIIPFFYLTQAALPHLKKAVPSLTPPLSPLTRATKSSSIIQPPKVPSSPLHALLPFRSPIPESVSTVSPPGRSGHRSFPPASPRPRSASSERILRWGVPLSLMNWPEPMSIWPVPILLMSQAHVFMLMEGTWSQAELPPAEALSPL